MVMELPQTSAKIVQSLENGTRFTKAILGRMAVTVLNSRTSIEKAKFVDIVVHEKESFLWAFSCSIVDGSFDVVSGNIRYSLIDAHGNQIAGDTNILFLTAETGVTYSNGVWQVC